MTGIQTVNNRLYLLYGILICLCICGFALYDLKKRRVPDRALVFFCSVALLAPFLRAMAFPIWQLFLPSAIVSLGGAAAGLGILLAAALFSEGGAGIGGGDIKLAGIMGFIYGPSQMIGILFIASVLAVLAAFIIKSRRGGVLSLPFVPFLAAGSLVVTLTVLFR